MTDRRRHRAAHADPSDESPGTHDADVPDSRDNGEPRDSHASGASRAPEEENPFAPPPEGQPDRPWQPRHPEGSQDGTSGEGGGNGSDGGSGQPPRWGGRWSPRQPGRQNGGFGQDRQDGNGGNGGGNGDRDRRGMRWDPRDRLQRHARYALHTGIWGLFFALFSLTEIALLLGALSVYWAISALRGRSRRGGRQAARAGNGQADGTARADAEDVAGSDRTGAGAQNDDGPPVKLSVTPAQAAKAQLTAAVSGLVTGGIALVIVLGTFALEVAYSDYYTCKRDALTQPSREECKDMLPDGVRTVIESRD